MKEKRVMKKKRQVHESTKSIYKERERESI